MSKKPTTAQVNRLEEIRGGYAVTGVLAQDPTANRPARVLSFHSAVEGDTILAHRTVESSPTPRTEMFRVSADGTARGV